MRQRATLTLALSSLLPVNNTELQSLILLRRLCASGEARAHRLRANVSLTEAAEACGITPAQLSRWETGQRRPRGDAAMRYARLLASLRRGGNA